MEQTPILLKNGTYKILKLLNTGGFGSVYKGINNELNHLVAIKELLPDQMENPVVVDLFKQEAQVLLSLQHKNIVQFEDFFLEGNRFYIVMEFVEGGSLADRIASFDDSTRTEVGKKLSTSHRSQKFESSLTLKLATIAEIACQVCDGLTQPHAQGIFHCDLKPGNLLLSIDKNIKIADFGIARIRKQFIHSFEANQFGTLDYASPEQIKGEEIDQRSDIYSLGIILYELAIGRKPFVCSATTTEEWVNSIQQQQLAIKPQPISLLRTDIPIAFETIILNCLEKSPEDRYKSVGDLKNDILKVIQPGGLQDILPETPIVLQPLSTSGKAICPFCGSRIETVISGTFQCEACSHPLLLEDGEVEAAMVDTFIDQKLREFGLTYTASLSRVVLDDKFLQLIYEKWLKLEEQFLDREFSILLQNGVFAFPQQLNPDLTSFKEEDVLSLAKRTNLLLYCWESTQVKNFIFGLKAQALQNASQSNLKGKAYFLIGLFNTIKGHNLSGELQAFIYGKARDWLTFSESSFKQINSSFSKTARNCIELCQIFERNQDTQENIHKALSEALKRFEIGNGYEKVTAENIELILGENSERTTFTPVPWLRVTKLETRIICCGIPFDFIRIPDGKFKMGAERKFHRLDSLPYEQSEDIDGDEVVMGEYLIGKYPITIRQFSEFILAEAYQTTAERDECGRVFTGTGWVKSKNALWKNPDGSQSSKSEKHNHPVTQISFLDAIKFCKWFSKITKKSCTLPTEPQWEKAARGTDQRIFPWGNEEPDQYLTNFNCSINGTKPIGYFSRGDLNQKNFLGAIRTVNLDSPYGCCDLAGNVWEWTRSLFKPYPYISTDGRENLEAPGPRVIRGGAFDSTASELRTFTRRKMYPNEAYGNLGFRIVVLEK